jgi:hypothetical protein
MNLDMIERLKKIGQSLQPWSEDEAVDLRLMPGGLGDLESFYLLLGSIRDGTVCEDETSGLSAEALRSDEMEELRLNTCILQILLTAKRILRCRQPDTAIDGDFVQSHASILRRHREVPEGLFEDPAGYLFRLAKRNAVLMIRLFDRHAEEE